MEVTTTGEDSSSLGGFSQLPIWSILVQLNSYFKYALYFTCQKPFKCMHCIQISRFFSQRHLIVSILYFCRLGLLDSMYNIMEKDLRSQEKF